ncbi:helix-hairpin-helix domain-containing protein, partial [Nocardia brasiliensis]|uniref:helix-hairpin-helix domain-containing protein n=1 Tax=Nocardia brasiliensis TaxID=37326 RepID=UPI002455AF71
TISNASGWRPRRSPASFGGWGAGGARPPPPALVTHFGSVAKLKEATVEQITEVPGIGLATAKAVLAALQEG